MGHSDDDAVVVSQARPTDRRRGGGPPCVHTGSVCCGLLPVNATFICLIAFDLLILSHSLIFTITNLASGQERYEEGNPVVAQILAYYLLLPLLIIQIVWLLTAVVAFFSLRTLVAYFQLPYLIVSGSLVAVYVWITVQTAHAYAHYHPTDVDLSWVFVLVLAFTNVLLALHLLFVYLKSACFRLSLRKRNTVTTFDKDKMAIASVDAQCDTYSTRSTVIITDEYLQPPSP